jgi:hypothetical protein
LSQPEYLSLKAQKLERRAEQRRLGLIAQRTSKGIEYRLRGDNEAALAYRGAWILSGPSETGKTIAALSLVNRLAWEHPGCQGVILRKIAADLTPTVLQTFEKKILGADSPVTAYGGERPQWYDYPNGSRVWVAGLDDAGKSLSSERDFAYVNQAEQLTRDDWETIGTRTTGRAGVIVPGLLFGDCNPAGQRHWILEMAREGALKLYKSHHKDNPALYDDAGNLTEQGRVTLESLAKLTGHRRSRLFVGDWMTPEGIVYSEFSEDNIMDAEPDLALPFELAADDGFVDPRVVLLIQRTPTRILVFDELCHTRHLAETCVRESLAKAAALSGKVIPDEIISGSLSGIAAWCRGTDDETKKPRVQLPDIVVGSPEAKEMQERFRLADISFRLPSEKGIKAGIDVMRRLVCDSNGYRALQVNRRCKNLIYELTEGYQYPQTGARHDEELPIDKDNHSCDALRMWCVTRAR